MKKDSVYPFCAVYGQEAMKNALIWNAVNPKIGGALLCGEKGTAKSTVVRALSAVLRDVKVVELPLNATEDRLVGSIDFRAAVGEGVRRFEPGILMEAHKNFLYVDEVNLLADHIVNGLLEAAASGVNRVEREGTSWSHPSEFVLIGSMNPEEGRLRPQFLDRFGLYVEVRGSSKPEERVEIARRRLEYERAPEKFIALWEDDTRKLRQKIEKAKEFLKKVVVADGAMRLAATYSAEASCAGQRAEIVITETARAIAALDMRTAVNAGDIAEAAKYALPHRMRASFPRENPGAVPEDEAEGWEDRREDHEAGPERQRETDDDRPPEPEKERDGADEPRDEREGEETPEAHDPYLPPPRAEAEDEIQEIGQTFEAGRWLSMDAAKKVRLGSGRRSLVKTSSAQGRYVKAVFPKGDFHDIALDATLRAAAPRQFGREKNGMALSVEESDIRVKIREKRIGNTILFLVDASGSMGANRRMAAVKGAVCSLLNDAYQKRDRVGLIAFRKKSAELILGITRSVELARKKLETLPTGGRTPLGAGLTLAREVLRTERLKDRDMLPVLVVLSDGRANAALVGDRPMDEALAAAGRIAADGIKCVVIDTEKDFIRLELSKKLALGLKADYFRIEDLNAELLTGLVRASV